MTATKQCTKCGVTKSATAFQKDSRGRLGRQAACSACYAIALREWRKANPEKVKAQRDKHCAIHAEVLRQRALARYYKSRERQQQTSTAWKARNHERVKEWRAEWNKKNRHKTRVYVATRVTGKLRATPAWADIEAIKLIYAKSVEWHMSVDHIVPLRSKLVCGLHVPDNLQLLKPKENLAKWNRHWPDMP